MAPSCYKRCDITNYRALKVLYLVRFALTHPNLSTRLLYVNVSSLSSCESQVFYMTAAGNEAKTSTSSARRPWLFNLIFLCNFFYCNFEVFSFILVLENKRDCSPHKEAISCLCYMFSVPCLRLLCHFLSPVVFVVSLYLILFSLLASCIYSIYSPSVSLVLCELLNVMVVCLPAILFFVPFGFWLIICSSFSMKCLHIDPCLCLFSPAFSQHYSFWLECLFD